MNPVEAIDQAFLQLAFAIKMMNYVELGKLDKDVFDTTTVIVLHKCRNETIPANTFNTIDDLTLAAQNSFIITLGFTALVLDKALEVAGHKKDLPQLDPMRDLRALVYMIRCAFAHDMMHPRWRARGEAFARRLEIELSSGPLIVDMADLNGKPLELDQLGGYAAFFQIKDEVRRILSASVADTKKA